MTSATLTFARTGVAIAALMGALTAGASALRAETLKVYRGTIEDADSEKATIRTRSGQSVVLTFPERPKIFSALTGRLSDVKPESYIGATAMPQPDGTQKALQLTVFSSSLRGTSDGHAPSDLVDGAATTNGAVQTLEGTKGRVITVRYRDGEKTIVAADGTPVNLVDPGDKSLLISGAPIVAFTQPAPGGKIRAVIVVVGRNGTVPAM
ncbi:hypothetical protein [Methylobacterium sp. Leaf466]|uniref:hypothetical protein n=1 Tax=Methylobacterium sp. Leaf466 TaxID=1736386 RepID=UPI000A6CEDF8|nr:hypothetical protein [Methylobacterium sp. Leaf466]